MYVQGCVWGRAWGCVCRQRRTVIKSISIVARVIGSRIVIYPLYCYVSAALSVSPRYRASYRSSRHYRIVTCGSQGRCLLSTPRSHAHFAGCSHSPIDYKRGWCGVAPRRLQVAFIFCCPWPSSPATSGRPLRMRVAFIFLSCGLTATHDLHLPLRVAVLFGREWLSSSCAVG